MVRIPTRLAAGVAALVTALTLSGCGPSASPASAPDPDTITIAHIPSEDQTTIEQSWGKIVQVLEKETGKKVVFQQVTSYAAVIEAQRAGKAQIASYGPFSYMVAKDSNAGVELVGYAAKSPSDPGGYYSVASVPKDSTITDLSGFRGKKVCFVDPTSTSGYLFPSAGLLNVGIDPVKGVQPVIAGGHDASVLAVASHQCDAGFSTEQMATQQLIKSGQLKPGDIKIVWRSELIPPSPVAISTKLSPQLREKIKNIFLDDLNADALKRSGDCDPKQPNCGLPNDTWGYRSVDDHTYDGIRKVCAITKSQSCNA